MNKKKILVPTCGWFCFSWTRWIVLAPLSFSMRSIQRGTRRFRPGSGRLVIAFTRFLKKDKLWLCSQLGATIRLLIRRLNQHQRRTKGAAAAAWNSPGESAVTQLWLRRNRANFPGPIQRICPPAQTSEIHIARTKSRPLSLLLKVFSETLQFSPSFLCHVNANRAWLPAPDDYWHPHTFLTSTR